MQVALTAMCATVGNNRYLFDDPGQYQGLGDYRALRRFVDVYSNVTQEAYMFLHNFFYALERGILNRRG